MNAEEYQSMRGSLKMSQAELASHLGVTRETIVRRESGAAVISREAELAIKSICQPPAKTSLESKGRRFETVTQMMDAEKVSPDIPRPRVIERREREPIFGGMLRDPKKGESGK